MALKMVDGKLVEVDDVIDKSDKKHGMLIDEKGPSVTNPLGAVTNEDGTKLETREDGPAEVPHLESKIEEKDKQLEGLDKHTPANHSSVGATNPDTLEYTRVNNPGVMTRVERVLRDGGMDSMSTLRSLKAISEIIDEQDEINHKRIK